MPEGAEQQTGVVVQDSMELLRYKEELASKVGLPSQYSMNLIKATCREMVDSGFAPACFKSNPSALFMAVMRGKELDLGPMESILETFWASPQGRLGMMSTKMGEIMRKRNVQTEFLKDTDEECVVLLTPPNGHPPYTSTFHIDEARRAGLVKPDSNWVKWPRNMLRARAISNGWRAIGGTFGASANIYSQEEIQDMEASEPSAPAATPESTEVKAGARPKAAKDVTVEAKAEVVADKVVPIDTKTSAAPPDTAPKPAVERTVSKTEYLVYIGGKATTFHTTDLTEAMTKGQADRDERKVVTEVERVATFSDGTVDRKMVARFDPEQVVEQTTAAPAEAALAEGTVKSTVTPEEREALKARVLTVQATIPAKDDEARKKVLTAFACGYFGVNRPMEWPKNVPDREAMLNALELSLQRQTDRDFVVSSPKKAGEQAKIRGAVVTDPVYVSLKWSPETIAAAKPFRELFSFQTDQDFLDYAGMFLNCDEPDAYAYMRMAVVAGRGSETLKLLRDVSKAMSEPYGAVIGSLAKFVGELSADNMKNIEAGLRKMLAHATGQQQEQPVAAPAATTAPSEPAATADDEGWD